MSNGWRLAAGILTVLVVLVFAGCGGEEGSGDRGEGLDPGVPPGPRAPERPAGLSLARVGTIGDYPEEDARVVVDVTADGAISVAGEGLGFGVGEGLGFRALSEFLTERADRARENLPAEPSLIGVVLRMDETVPWAAAQRLMQECAHPEIRIYRIFFAVLPEAGDEEGTIATWLPMDRGLARVDNSIIGPGGGAGGAFGGRRGFRGGLAPAVTKCGIAAGGPEVSPVDLYRALMSLPKEARRQVRIDAEPLVSVGCVLRAVDALHRAGAGAITFVGAPHPTAAEAPGDFVDLVAEAKEADVTPGFTLLDRPVTPSAAPGDGMPAVERARGGFTGTAAAPPLVEEPIIEDIEEGFDDDGR